MYYFDVSLNLFEKPKQIIVKKTEYDIAKAKLENENKKRKEEEKKKEDDKRRILLENKERLIELEAKDKARKEKEQKELEEKKLKELLNPVPSSGGKKKSKKIGLRKKTKGKSKTVKL